MKKQKFVSTLFIIICFVFVFKAGSAGRVSINYSWGTEFVKVKKAIPSTEKFEQFSPKEKSHYRNKILSYITAIDNSFIDKIIVLRVLSRPATDYLFVNNRLYTIMENWGRINNKTVKEIQTRLTGKYGQPQLQKDKKLSIYSYSNNKTRVLYYILKNGDGSYRCKVYYYARKLFRMLIME